MQAHVVVVVGCTLVNVADIILYVLICSVILYKFHNSHNAIHKPLPQNSNFYYTMGNIPSSSLRLKCYPEIYTTASIPAHDIGTNSPRFPALGESQPICHPMFVMLTKKKNNPAGPTLRLCVGSKDVVVFGNLDSLSCCRSTSGPCQRSTKWPATCVIMLPRARAVSTTAMLAWLQGQLISKNSDT